MTRAVPEVLQRAARASEAAGQPVRIIDPSALAFWLMCDKEGRTDIAGAAPRAYVIHVLRWVADGLEERMAAEEAER